MLMSEAREVANRGPRKAEGADSDRMLGWTRDSYYI